MTTARSSSANTRFAAPISGAGDALGKQRPRGDHCAGASHGHSSQQRSRSSGRRRAERHSRKAKDHGVRLEAEHVMLRMPKGGRPQLRYGDLHTSSSMYGRSTVVRETHHVAHG